MDGPEIPSAITATVLVSAVLYGLHWGGERYTSYQP